MAKAQASLGRELASIEVEVGAADAAIVDADGHTARLKRGNRDVLDLELVGARDDGGFHRGIRGYA